MAISKEVDISVRSLILFPSFLRSALSCHVMYRVRHVSSSSFVIILDALSFVRVGIFDFHVWRMQACGFEVVSYTLLNVRGDNPLQMTSGASSWAPTSDATKIT